MSGILRQAQDERGCREPAGLRLIRDEQGHRTTRRRLLATAAVAAVAAGCARGGAKPARAPASSSGSPPVGGTLEVYQANNPPTLDLQRTTSFYSKVPLCGILSRLMRFKTGADPKVAADHDVEGDLAQSVESPDGITWTVKLRGGARFQNVAPVNGHAVQAEDVRATFARALDAANPARSALDMVDANQIQAPAPDTVVFMLKYPYAPFQATLASPSYSWIYPREALSGGYDPAKTVIGSGPFSLESYTPDVGFVLRKNPDWFEQGRPYVDAVQLSIIPDAARARAQFTGGHLDLLTPGVGTAITRAELDPLTRDNPRAPVIRVDPGGNGLSLFCQLGDPASPFQDIRVRRALSMAIDRDAFGKAMYSGDAEPQFYVYDWLGKWALHQNDVPPDVAQYYKFDPAGARKLLADAGLADHTFKLVYVAGFLGPAYEQAAQTLANMLAGAGIKITPLGVDYQKDYVAGGKGIRNGLYDKDWVICMGPPPYDEADEFIYNYYDAKSTAQLTRVKDADLDRMIDRARSILKEEDRAKAYVDIQKYLAEKMYTSAGLPAPYLYGVVGPRVQNYQLSLTYGALTESFTKLSLKT